MISYIFKNKTKNILAIVFTVLYILNTNLIYWIYTYISFGQVLSLVLEVILSLLPYILIVIYLCTLKRQYRFKDWLFPVAFIIFSAKCIFTIIDSFKYNVDYVNSLEGVFWLLSIVIYDMVLFTGYVLCFCGTIKNFKNNRLFRIGLIILMAAMLVYPLAELLTINTDIDLGNAFLNYLGLLVPSMAKTLYDIFIQLLFLFGLLNLTLNQKSEDIDITPYIEARKAKKEVKRTAKLEAKQQEEARLNESAPEIPDGSWRCMACGEILPDSIERCECGYKR